MPDPFASDSTVKKTDETAPNAHDPTGAILEQNVKANLLIEKADSKIANLIHEARNEALSLDQKLHQILSNHGMDSQQRAKAFQEIKDLFK